MNIYPLKTLCVLATAAFGVTQAAHADTTNADCQVREKGNSLAMESGACTYSQRQGNVSIRLRNGEEYDLRPGNSAGKYKDQKNRDVKRKVEGDKHVYDWNHRHITVSFNNDYRHNNSGHHNNSHNNGRGTNSSHNNEERGDPEAGFAEWQAEQERSGGGVPEIIMGRNGEGEVTFSNNCVVYYNSRGQRTETNSNCKSGQGRTADDAMARHRREQGY